MSSIDKPLGIDLGLKDFLATSDSATVAAKQFCRGLQPAPAFTHQRDVIAAKNIVAAGIGHLAGGLSIL